MNTASRFCLAFAGAAALGLPALASSAFARGPGNYTVKGINGPSGSGYTGSASLSQTGKDTWRITWRIGSQSWNGFGIGDGKIIAVNYSGQGTTGVILLIEKEDGSGYEAAWANSGDREVGIEEWRKTGR